MRLHVFRAGLALCGAVLVSHPAWASDSETRAQLEAMQQRLLQLEDRLDATSDQLEAAEERIVEQQALIEESGLSETSSGVSDFLESLEIGGWVAASYFYNFDDPDGRDLGGFNAGGVPAFPFHPDANSFQLDQVWFELERPVSEEQRAGFRTDIVIGKTGDLLSGFADGRSGTGLDFHLYQGYVQYLAPIGNGVTIQAGKFATVIGAEVAQAPYNLNITRGHVYNLFQPITHVGILAGTEFGSGFSGKLGFVNETRCFTACDVDLNKDKAFLWSLGWSGDQGVGFSFNGAHGAADSGQGTDLRAGDRETIYDVILSYSPTERFTSYVNADYIESENSLAGADDLEGYGVAVAGRYALTDRMGLALRGEWVDLDAGEDFKIWGVTTTVDYALTEKLTVRGEVRYDNANTGDIDEVFFDSLSSTLGVPGSGIVQDEEDQVVAGVEVIYSF